MSFLGEIKRRKVFQVAAVYAVVAWLLVQIVATVEEPLGLPAWFDTAIIVFLVVGFPIAVILSWAFELTPQGVEPDSSVERAAIVQPPGQRLSFIIQGLVLTAVGFLVLDQYFLGPRVDSGTTAAINSSADARVSRFTYSLPSDQDFRAGGRNLFAISPDGRHFVYNATGGLYVRALDELEARLIPGTEQAASPDFSPDGESVVFSHGSDQLRRAPINGGPWAPVSEGLSYAYGISWETDGSILVGQRSGIFRVSENGGTLERVVPVAPDQWYGSPRLLPDGDHILLSVAPPAAWESGQIVVQSLTTSERDVIIPRGKDARYLPTGHIVYVDGDTLFAAPFDAATRMLTGGAIPLVQGIRRSDNGNTGVAQYDISANGTLIYATGGSLQSRTLAWVDRDGNEEPIPIQPGTYLYPRMSPDGTRVALDDRNAANDIWVWNIESGTLRRLTLGSGGGGYPAWTPNGNRIAYDAAFGSIDWRAANDTGIPEQLAVNVSRPGASNPTPYFFSHDGRYLVFRERDNPLTGHNIGMTELAATSEPIWLLEGAADEMNAELSADGHWMAYESNETGRVEIYVRPFPNVDDNIVPISNAGGRMALWSRDGRELFYLEPQEDGLTDHLISITFEATDTDFVVLSRTPIIEEWRYRGTTAGGGRPYDQSLDGSRFIVVKDNFDQGTGQEIIVVQNWFEELNRLAPRSE